MMLRELPIGDLPSLRHGPRSARLIHDSEGGLGISHRVKWTPVGLDPIGMLDGPNVDRNLTRISLFLAILLTRNLVILSRCVPAGPS